MFFDICCHEWFLKPSSLFIELSFVVVVFVFSFSFLIFSKLKIIYVFVSTWLGSCDDSWMINTVVISSKARSGQNILLAALLKWQVRNGRFDLPSLHVSPCFSAFVAGHFYLNWLPSPFSLTVFFPQVTPYLTHQLWPPQLQLFIHFSEAFIQHFLPAPFLRRCWLGQGW